MEGVLTRLDLLAHSEAGVEPTLSIVIVNSDGLQDTLRCIESIYLYPPRYPFEIILIDNCSSESSLSPVASRFPQVRSFVAPRRQGFAKNYNQGISEARGDYILVLNNDTLMLPGALNTLVEALSATPAYGMLGPRLLGRDGVVQYDCARRLPTPLGYIIAQLVLDAGFPPGRLWRCFLTWSASRRASGPVPCISGACMLVRRADLAKVGPLDEGFDFYYEDVEWCHRFQRYGHKIGYVSEACITHLGDQSLSKVKVWAKRSEYRSALRYFSTYYHLTGSQQDLLWLATTLNYFLRGFALLFAEMLSGERSYARDYLYLWAWLLSQRPSTIARDAASDILHRRAS